MVGGDDGGGGSGGDAWLSVQVYGLWMKRLRYGLNDLRKAVPMLLLPVGASAAAFALNATGVMFRPGGMNSNILTALICAGGYIPVVALVVEHVVSERVSKLRNVLTVMGCDLKSYWLGTLLGDMTLFGICIATTIVVVAVCASLPVTQVNTRDDDYNDMVTDDKFGFPNEHKTHGEDDAFGFERSHGSGTGKVGHLGSQWRFPLLQYLTDGRLPVLLLLFGLQLCSFSYFTSFWFASPNWPSPSCVLLHRADSGARRIHRDGLLPPRSPGLHADQPQQNDTLRGMLWFITITSPHGAFPSACST